MIEKTPHSKEAFDAVAQINSNPKSKGSSVEVSSTSDDVPERVNVPLIFKLGAILMVSAIGFGSHWSSGVTGAMKTTLKKELHINNKQYALLDASQDFMVTVLVLVSGVVTDRIGGASAIMYGNAIYSIGSILIAAATTVRSWKFMVVGEVVLSLGDIATQIAQYKIFSSWFPPSHGFASTLGLELGIGKIGSFVGKSTANIIAKNTGDFSWVYWTAVFMNLFTNLMTVAFYFFNKYCNQRFQGVADPATGERLKESNRKFELRKVLELPWTFWIVMAFSLFETSTAIVFSVNATELAQIRFSTSAITAGWYTSVLQYAGFFLVPCIGVFIDLYGSRLTLFAICGGGVFLAMALVNWAPTEQGTAAAFGIFAVAFSLGPTLIIDSLRTAIWHQSVFGSAYAIKVTMNNAINIIIRIVTGVLQDQSPASNEYEKVTPVYVVLSLMSFVVALSMIFIFFTSKHCSTSSSPSKIHTLISNLYLDIGRLQWTRKQRIANGELIKQRKRIVGLGDKDDESVDGVNEGSVEERRERAMMAKFSVAAFGALCLLVLGSWAAYFWGVVTGHNS